MTYGLLGEGFTKFFSDRSRADWSASTYLASIDPRQLFDGSYFWGNTPGEHRFLVQCFYDNFGHRQICHESIWTFRRMLRGRYFAVADRFEKLFNTLDTIKDPFETFYEVGHAQQENKHRDSGTHNRSSRNDANRIDQHGEAVQTARQDWDEHQSYDTNRDRQVGQNKSQATDNSVGTDAFTRYNMFTDTPQTQGQVAVETGDIGQGTVDAKDGAAALGFNKGYMTNATRDTNNETSTKTDKSANTGTTQSDNTEQGLSGSSGHDYAQGTHNTSSLVHGTTQQQSINNYRDETGGLSNQTNQSVRHGFTGQSRASLLKEYRETLIPMVGEFLSCFDDLFIHIY